MSRTTKTFITTDDTGETFEMDGVYRPGRQLWAVEVRITALDTGGNYSYIQHRPPNIFYVRRATIEKLGLAPYQESPKPETPEAAKDELRETLEKLLSLVGVYPEGVEP